MPEWSVPDIFEYLEGAQAAEVVRTFRRDTGRRIGLLCHAFEKGDLTRLRAEAHAVKGSARQMGADTLAHLCQEIEKNVAETTAGRLGELQAHLEQVHVAMMSYTAAKV